jgi:GT2 family glycosyltransferase
MVFDERLFMYYEDVDLAWRLQVRGFRCVFAPRAVVYHRVSATGGGPLASYLVARNALVVLRRSVPPQFIRRYRLRIAAHHAGRVWATLPHVREAAARATLRGAFAGLVAFARERPAIDDPPDETLRRIAGLLAHAKPLSDSGLPVSRLRRGLDADAQRSTAPR